MDFRESIIALELFCCLLEINSIIFTVAYQKSICKTYICSSEAGNLLFFELFGSLKAQTIDHCVTNLCKKKTRNTEILFHLFIFIFKLFSLS